MEIRYAVHPDDVQRYCTEDLRNHFLIEDLFCKDTCKMVYSHADRVIVGGVCPSKPQDLKVEAGMGVEYFLERREMGIINIGGSGTVMVDGVAHVLQSTDGLYIGRGVREVVFSSEDPEQPAKFYFNSAPAHSEFPTVKIERSSIVPNDLGDISNSNQRKIYKYIHPQGVQSCQLVMGMTVLAHGNMWNSMPSHTHDRRMEVYFYFNLPEDNVVFHYMGQPQETRHIVMKNEQAVISPSWSIHSGVGTHNYTFIWGMAGENQVFDDMDAVAMKDLR